MEPNSQLARRGDLGGQQIADTTRVEVEVVGRRRASAQGELGYLPLDAPSLPRQLAIDQAGHIWIENAGIQRVDLGP